MGPLIVLPPREWGSADSAPPVRGPGAQEDVFCHHGVPCLGTLARGGHG